MKKILNRLNWLLSIIVVVIFMLGLLLSGCKKEDVHPREDVHPSNLSEGKIVFAGLEGWKSNLYILDNSGLNKITNTDSLNFNGPAWSPDGSRIVFVKGTSIFSGALYSMDQDGSSQTLIYSSWWESPSWSPDGEWLCFVKPNGGNVYKICSDGTDFHEVVDVNGGDPEWSPDGNRIVFWNVVNSNFEIFSVNVNGSELTNLTNSQYSEESPTWSPDGTLIAFSRGGDESGNNIYYMDADGGNVTQVTQFTNESAYSPCWSPDGTQIAFVKQGNLYVINIDGSNLKVLYNGEMYVNTLDWY